MNERSVYLSRQPPSRERPIVVHGPFFEALNTNNRVVDFQTARLPLATLKEWVYELRRRREMSGARITVIDCMASGHTTAELCRALLADCRKLYGPPEFAVDPIDKMVAFNSSAAVKHTLVDIPEIGCRLALISSDQDLFDDRNQPDNELVFIDWSDLSGYPPRPDRPESHLIVTGFSGFSND